MTLSDGHWELCNLWEANDELLPRRGKSLLGLLSHEFPKARKNRDTGLSFSSLLETSPLIYELRYFSAELHFTLFACCCVTRFVLRQPTNVHVPVWMLHLEGSRRYIHKWWLIFATVIQTFWLHTRANEWKMTSCCSCIVHAARDMKPHVVVRLDWCSHESFWKLFTETRLVYARLYIRETKSRCFDERFGRVSVAFACQYIYEKTLFAPGIKNKNTCT